MTQDDLIKKVEQYHKEALDLMRAKNSDYTRKDQPFYNFELSEHFVGVSTEKGILIRMADKMARLGSLLNKEASIKTESMADSLIDLSNYALILRAYLENKNNK